MKLFDWLINHATEARAPHLSLEGVVGKRVQKNDEAIRTIAEWEYVVLAIGGEPRPAIGEKRMAEEETILSWWLLLWHRVVIYFGAASIPCRCVASKIAFERQW